MRVIIEDDNATWESIKRIEQHLIERLDEFRRNLTDLEMYVVTGVRAGNMMNSKPAQEPAPQYEPKMKATYDEAKQKRENAK